MALHSIRSISLVRYLTWSGSSGYLPYLPTYLRLFPSLPLTLTQPSIASTAVAVVTSAKLCLPAPAPAATFHATCITYLHCISKVSILLRSGQNTSRLPYLPTVPYLVFTHLPVRNRSIGYIPTHSKRTSTYTHLSLLVPIEGTTAASLSRIVTEKRL